MAIKRFTLPAIGRFEGKKDHFILGEMSELADALNAIGNPKWNGRQRWTNFVDFSGVKARVKYGDKASVEASDKFMRQVEEVLPAPTARHELIDDVVGACPNVPAYLAGVPMNMRRKVKRENEAAPIAIIVNMTTSAAISGEQMSKRGAAIAALARALSSRRPVELWAGCGMDSNGHNAVWNYWRIETAPLDLARAAFLLAHPAATRFGLYNICGHYHASSGHWPYSSLMGDADTERAIVRRAFPHVEDMIYVPSAFGNDQVITDPIAWVKENVAAHIGEEAGE